MARKKSPAFLFYSSDFTTGTQFLTNEQVGIYIRLMCAQHQHGRLSEHHMNIICASYDIHSKNGSAILEKFVVDEDGRFYNERLEYECEKRGAFSKSRGENRLKGLEKKKLSDSSPSDPNASYDDHMKVMCESYEHHMEKEKENIYTSKEHNIGNLKNGVEEKTEPLTFTRQQGDVFPGPDDIHKFVLPKLKAGSVVELVRITQKKDVTIPDVYQLFEAFKILHFTGSKYYRDESEIQSHFINWAKTQKFDNGHKPNTAGSGSDNNGRTTGFNSKNGGFQRIADALRDEIAVPHDYGSTEFGAEI